MTANLRLVTRQPLERVYPHDPERRGFVVQYLGPQTPCPGCHRTNWLVGRTTVECAFCSTALPLGTLSKEPMK